LEHKIIIFDIIHIVGIIYSMYALTFIVGFDLPPYLPLLIIESIVILESICYFVLNFLMYIKIGKKFKTALKVYYQNGMLCDMVACSPMNLILWGLEVGSPVWVIAPIRLMRLLSVPRLQQLMSKLEVHYLQVAEYLTAFKAILFLIMLWHWSSCVWFFTNFKLETAGVQRWFDLHNLEDADLDTRYLFSVYFTMNIVTSVGYGDMHGANDTERILTCVIILTGDALFAVAFGMMASLAANKENEFNNYLAEINNA
jgi:hypothetical protein